jgi:hypothetical protein
MCWAILYKSIQVQGFQVKAPLVQPPMLQGNKGKDAAFNSLLIRWTDICILQLESRSLLCIIGIVFACTVFFSSSLLLDFCSRTLDISLGNWLLLTIKKKISVLVLHGIRLVLINKIVLERKQKCLKYSLNLSQFLENSSKILGDVEVFLLGLIGCSFEFEWFKSAFDTKKVYLKKKLFFW